MAKSDAVDRLMASLQATARGRGYDRARKTHMGFANDREADFFRAAAASYPTPVLVTREMPKAWKKLGDHLVEHGSLNAVIITGGTAYKLTPAGKRRAIAEGIIKEKRNG